MRLSNVEDGLTVICEDPDPDTFPPVTSIVSTVLSSDVFLIVISPLSTSTLSSKFKTIFAFTSTAVALSAGDDEERVGAVVSGTVTTRSHCVPDELFKAQFFPPNVPDVPELMFEDEIPLTTALYVPAESVLEGSIAKD